ncbi:MAG: GtrA family protein [Chitinophagaceae bacterium]|nr:MAG: GtrA family protein [Chitinophagaceae bacterium]
MRQIHHSVRKTIFAVLDVFYPMFKRFMPIQTYHYAACGGGNTLFNIFLYHMFYNFVLHKQVVHVGMLAFKPHVAAFIMAFFVTFPIGFYLSMYVVFQGSYLRRRIQLIRYFMVAMACVGLNYILLKFFIETLGWNEHPTLALMATAVIVVTFSYVSQRFFSFRVDKTKPAVAEVSASARIQKKRERSVNLCNLHA